MGKTIELTIDVERGYEVFRTWRVVETDNGAGDYPDEKFVAIDIAGPVLAEGFAKMWNALINENDPKERIFKVVEHIEIRYKLIPGFEP
jgi:hypothetical protein